MKSGHIDNRKLQEVAGEKAVLEQAEVEHLKGCEECMEMIRLFVHQDVSKGGAKRTG